MDFKPFQSANIHTISEALVGAQSEYSPIPKGKTAGKAGGKQWTYADLTDVLEHMLPILTKHGLAFTQREQYHEGQIFLVTILSHKQSGEWIGSFKPLHPADTSDQSYGSCMSYQRRYSAYGILGIHPSDEDDDGQSAKEASGSKETSGSSEYINPSQINLLKMRVNTPEKKQKLGQIMKDMGIQEVHKIPWTKFNSILQYFPKED